jgi:pilus assembly protein CpaE
MTMPIVALVADEQSVRHPELLGLAGENLAAQRWLALLTSADDARAFLARDTNVQEVWVAACGPIAPINLAATIKRDRAGRRVCMLSAQESGSLLSRSAAAGIDASLSPQAFIERYARCKHLAQQGSFGVAGGVGCAGGAAGGVAVDGVGAGELGAGAAGGAGGPAGAGSGAGAAASGAAGGIGMAASSGAGVGFGAPGAQAAGRGSASGPGPSGNAFAKSAYAQGGGFAVGQGGSIASNSPFAQANGANGAGDLSARGGCSGQGAHGAVRGKDMSASFRTAPQAASDSAARAASAPTTPSHSGLLIPVVSASGGCGKSSVAVLSAFLLQAAGFNTLLLDFDLQFGDAAELMGVDQPLRIDEVLKVPSRLDGLKSEGKVPALLAAPAHVDAAEAVIDQAAELIDGLRTRFDVIVANTGAAWAEQHAVLLERSSKVLFLVDQRRTSIRATRRALDLCGRCGIAVNPFVFALNGCGKGAPLTSIDVSCALKGSEVRELRDGGPDVEDLLAAGAPLELVEYGNGLCESLLAVLADMLPAEAAQRLQAADDSSSGGSLFRPRKSRRRKRG